MEAELEKRTSRSDLLEDSTANGRDVKHSLFYQRAIIKDLAADAQKWDKCAAEILAGLRLPRIAVIENMTCDGEKLFEIFDEIDLFPGDFHKMRAALYSLEKANDRAPGYMPTLKKTSTL
jgi:hypothetical protein